MNFYLDKPMPTMATEKELLDILKQNEKVFILSDDPNQIKDISYPIKIIEKMNNYTLFTNK